MIDPITVAKILDTAQITEVVGDFVTLRKRGVNYVGLCPFHDEKTGSFTVSPAKGIFKCFGCGKGGGAVHFIMEHEQLDYPGALRYLAKKYGIPIVEKELTDAEKSAQSDRESMFALNEWAHKYFISILTETDAGRQIGLSYFRERGFTDETVRKFGLGFAPVESDAMCKAAIERGFKPDFIEKCGIGIRRDNGQWYDRFRGRAMFPVHTLSGKIVAFGGRILEKNDKAAKYVNSPESEIYHKSDELYGIYFSKQSIVKQDRCILVEGYTDVISMHQAGITNVVASSGTSLTGGQIRMIHRFTPNVTVIYDGDSAGIKASIRGIDMLLEEGMNVNVVLLPDGEDPDSYARSHNASDFIDFIEKNQVDFIRFKVKLLLEGAGDDPIKRAKLIQDVVQSVSLIPDRITRSVYTKECSTMLGVEERILVSEVNKRRSSKSDAEAKKAGYNPNNAPKHATNPAYRNETDGEIPPHLPDDVPPIHEGENYVFPDESAVSAHSRFYEFERNIMFYIVRDAETVMFSGLGEDGTPVELRVGRYFIDELSELRRGDGRLFYDPTYDKMFDEMERNINNEGFSASQYFKNNPDPNVSLIAADLLTDRYQLSRIFTKHEEYVGNPNDARERADYERLRAGKEREELCRTAMRVVFEYKDAIVKGREGELLAKLREAQTNPELDVHRILLDLQANKEVQKRLSAAIGQRVVVR